MKKYSSLEKEVTSGGSKTLARAGGQSNGRNHEGVWRGAVSVRRKKVAFFFVEIGHSGEFSHGVFLVAGHVFADVLLDF